MPSRIVRVGKMRQIITTVFTPLPDGQPEDWHEHVTLATPDVMTDTAKLRLLKINEQGKRWPQ